MKHFIATPAGRWLHLACAITCAATAHTILMHSVWLVATVMPACMAMGFWSATLALRNDEDAALKLLLVAPVALFLVAGIMAMGHTAPAWVGWLSGVAAIVFAVLAASPPNWKSGSKAGAAGIVALFTLAGVRIADAAPLPESDSQVFLPMFPRDVSEHGHRIDWLIVVSGVFLAILFVIMCAWMLIACLKHNRNHQAVYDHGDSKRAVTVTLGIALFMFVFVDGNLWLNSAVDMHEVYWNFEKVEKDPKVVRIQINAHQWAWDARYAGPDGKFNTADDVVTFNDIRVPVDRPVIFQMASVDVIHSFYLPNMRVKQDVVPGMLTRTWFAAKETGEFDLGCTQHCGVNHYKMKGRLSVLPDKEYERWLERSSRRAVGAYDPKDQGAHWGWEWKKEHDGV